MTLINCTWVGLWSGILATTVLLVVLEYSMDSFVSTVSDAAILQRETMTMVCLGVCVCVVCMWLDLNARFPGSPSPPQPHTSYKHHCHLQHCASFGRPTTETTTTTTTTTQTVLYTIFPAVLLGAGVAWMLTRWRNRPLAKLVAAHKTADNATNHREVYRFTDPTQVRAHVCVDVCRC